MNKEFGKGIEKIVTQSHSNENRVVGRFFKEAKSSEFVRARYHFTKLLHTLFPENIPNIHRSSTHPNEIEVTKKPHDEDHKIYKKYKENFSKETLHNKIPVDKKFQENLKTQEFLKRIFNIIYTTSSQTVQDLKSPHNYTTYKNEPVFLDSFEPWVYNDDGTPQKLIFNPETLKKEIYNLPKEKHKKALINLDKLIKLWEIENSKSKL